MTFEEKYNKKVQKNIDYLETITGTIKEQFDINKYVEPDGFIKSTKINGIDIKLSSDGICGIKKVIEFSKEDEIVDNYRLIRENRFLVWPAYAMSINQQRGFKNIFDDRIDLLLMDLKKFYSITKNNPIIDGNSSIINYNQVIRINECKLARSYLNVNTLIWLLNFNNFENFVDENNLYIFVDKSKENNDEYIVKNWAIDNTSFIFCKSYFNELIKRLKQEK